MGKRRVWGTKTKLYDKEVGNACHWAALHNVLGTINMYFAIMPHLPPRQPTPQEPQYSQVWVWHRPWAALQHPHQWFPPPPHLRPLHESLAVPQALLVPPALIIQRECSEASNLYHSWVMDHTQNISCKSQRKLTNISSSVICYSESTLLEKLNYNSCTMFAFSITLLHKISFHLFNDKICMLWVLTWKPLYLMSSLMRSTM